MSFPAEAARQNRDFCIEFVNGTAQQHQWVLDAFAASRFNYERLGHNTERVIGSHSLPWGTGVHLVIDWQDEVLVGGVSDFASNEFVTLEGIPSAYPEDVFFPYVTDPNEVFFDNFLSHRWLYRIHIRTDLDDPARDPVYTGKPFYMETIVHEVAHIIVDLTQRGEGERNGNVPQRITEAFGGTYPADWNAAPAWADRIQEAAAETIKDIFLPAGSRAFNNRTNWQLPLAGRNAFLKEILAPGAHPQTEHWVHQGHDYWMPADERWVAFAGWDELYEKNYGGTGIPAYSLYTGTDGLQYWQRYIQLTTAHFDAGKFDKLLVAGDMRLQNGKSWDEYPLVLNPSGGYWQSGLDVLVQTYNVLDKNGNPTSLSSGFAWPNGNASQGHIGALDYWGSQARWYVPMPIPPDVVSIDFTFIVTVPVEAVDIAALEAADPTGRAVVGRYFPRVVLAS